MNLKFLKGSKEDFFAFIKNIKPQDNALILSHMDLDGVFSALLLSKILESQNIILREIKFVNYPQNLISDLIVEIKEKNIKKIFIADLGLDSQYKDFEDFCNTYDVFYIDHHPIKKELDCKNVIKTESADCASMVLYELAKEFIDVTKWDFLLYATMISEFSYLKEENFVYLKNIYPKVSLENIAFSEAGLLSKKVSNALIYYKNNVEKVYDILNKKEFSLLDEISFLVETEIAKHLKVFAAKSFFNEKENLYFYELQSEYSIASTLATEFSLIEKDAIVLVLEKENNKYKISARNQSGRVNMRDFLAELLSGLDDLSSGGHGAAAAARFRATDLNEIKKRLGIL